MNKLTILLLAFVIFSCNEDTKKTKGVTPEAQTEQKEAPVKAEEAAKDVKDTKSTTTIPFLTDTKALEQDTSANPIESFKTAATTQAAKSITLTKDNIKTALEAAINYKHAVIVVGNHTIVKVTDLTNCKDSGAWGTCMPHVEGYIKKGDLKPMADYANNIIGLPDAQERTLYLFN